MNESPFRLERDFLGEIAIPSSAYWGVQTQRSLENSSVSGIRFPGRFIRLLALIKREAVEVNRELGLIDLRISKPIFQAANEVVRGELSDQFPLDVFQTGSGTSTNMNANEVIASRANEILGGKKGDRSPVHPNDHVNLGQSSNDVIPTCLHLAAVEALREELLPALKQLQLILEKKGVEFSQVVKVGRTHLQDAVPVFLGQEFDAYATLVRKGYARLENTLLALAELPLGGTAVGTGLNTHPRFAGRVISRLSEVLDFSFREADDHFEAQSAKEAVLLCASALKGSAVSLEKIAEDIRWLASGPRCGIGELILPELHAGSSIMPGKINPVLPEILLQATVHVCGAEIVISRCSAAGRFELNTMMPLMTLHLLESISILANATRLFADKCVAGIIADEKHCRDMVERSLALATGLIPRFGYDGAARIARQAYHTGKTILQVVMNEKLIDPVEAARLLDPISMIKK